MTHGGCGGGAGVLEYEKHIDFLRSTIRGVIEKRRAQGVRDDDHDILAFMLRECGKEGKEWVDDHEIMMQTITFLLAGELNLRASVYPTGG